MWGNLLSFVHNAFCIKILWGKTDLKIQWRKKGHNPINVINLYCYYVTMAYTEKYYVITDFLVFARQSHLNGNRSIL